ncbi:MAG: hypothetical protein M3263_04255 [Thermoproteota archaeon]|nr:hypothetical protein [Thermoproteota archaeon]
MDKVKNAMHVLAIAISIAMLSTAFVSLAIVPSTAQRVKAADDVNEKKDNQHYLISADHPNLGSSVTSIAASNDNLNQTKITELRISLHNLWVEHILWTRQYVVAAAADQPDAPFAAERLLKNQEDIGNALKLYYGVQAGNQLTSQLKDHITIAVDLLEAAKSGNSTALEEVEKKWYANADEIATLLSAANPNWTREDMLRILNEHLSLTKTEAVARLTGDYATDVTTFDALYKHAISMGDEFTAGIVKQFQEQFV